MTIRISTPSRMIGSGMTATRLLGTTGPAISKTDRDRARALRAALAARVFMVSAASIVVMLAAVLGSIGAARQLLTLLILLILLPVAALILIRVPVLSRFTVAFWSPRKHASSQDRPTLSGASHPTRERSPTHGAPEESAPNHTPPRLGPDQVITLTQDFERAIARQQESTLQLIRRQEQLIGDLCTLLRILQERVLIQQAQLEALGAPAAAEDRALRELIRHLPFSTIPMEQMLELSDQLNERLHRPPFSSEPQ